MIENMTFAGIDVGTTTTKAVVINADNKVLGRFVRRSGADLASAAKVAFKQALAQAGISRDTVQAIVATGYGRRNVPFDKLRPGPFAHATKTEIGCHGRGCFHYFPEAITVVDIGGQDSKIIKLDAQGRRTGFKMNRKCAAGTGAFLEEIAHKLDIPIGDFNGLAQAASKTAQIGSYCTVFTATEVLDRIRAGEKVDDVIRGLFDSVAKRVLEMDTLAGRVIMTGGVVAFNEIVAELLSTRAGIKVEIAPHPQEVGAFGAALFARESQMSNILLLTSDDWEMGCLPAMRESTLVGLITETDIFETFVEILGGRHASLRVTVLVPDVRGELARLAWVIARLGGNTRSVARFRSEQPGHAYLTFRLEGVEAEALVPALDTEVEKVVRL